jgi:hypothetical protein
MTIDRDTLKKLTDRFEKMGKVQVAIKTEVKRRKAEIKPSVTESGLPSRFLERPL